MDSKKNKVITSLKEVIFPLNIFRELQKRKVEEQGKEKKIKPNYLKVWSLK